MKKSIRLILSFFVIATFSNSVFADGNAFTPLNFDDSTPSAPKSAPIKPAAQTKINPISNAFSKVTSAKNDAAPVDSAKGEIPIGNDSIQNAILELDNAQVGIRNDLLNYKAKYADIDAQFKLIKNERNMLHKQVVSIERRIKSIDRAKEKIRKNML